MAGRIRQAWGSLKHWLVPPQHGWLERADKVYLSELGVVSKRRRHLVTGQPEIAASRKWPPETPLDTIGLCLSGGGIRSAAFCLGALQALDAKKITAGAAGGRTS